MCPDFMSPARPTVPPRKQVIAANWNGGMGPAAVVNSASKAQVKMAMNPIIVDKVFDTVFDLILRAR